VSEQAIANASAGPVTLLIHDVRKCDPALRRNRRTVPGTTDGTPRFAVPAPIKETSMKAIGTIALGTGALGLALLAQTALCSAQTSVTRQIAVQPVETTVAQGPDGTVVTRRPLDPTPDPGAPPFVPGPLRFSQPLTATVGQSSVYDQDVAPVAPPARHVATRRVVHTAHARTHTERPSTVGVATRTATRTVVQPPPDQPLVLSPAERQTVYRTIVHRDVYPTPAPAGVVVPPAVYPAGEDYAYRPFGWNDYAYRDDRYRYPYHWDGVALVPGARLPTSIPLSPVPPAVVATDPALAAYSYAYVDYRVYLVDPSTGIIAAELTQ
jgi:hypothetical protein